MEELLIVCRDCSIIVVQRKNGVWRYSVARMDDCEWGAVHYHAGDSFLSCRQAAVRHADEYGGVSWECRVS